MRALSSVVERCIHIAEVTGSNPVVPTGCSLIIYMRRNKVAIVQVQREIIEGFRGHAEATQLPEQIDGAQLMLDDGTRLHVLGISEARSGVHGVNVLVVGDSPPSEKPPRIGSYQCAYAVLLRTPIAQELDQWRGSPDSRNCLLCVELLSLVAVNTGRVTFGRTGTYRLYTRLIT